MPLAQIFLYILQGLGVVFSMLKKKFCEVLTRAWFLVVFIYVQ